MIPAPLMVNVTLVWVNLESAVTLKLLAPGLNTVSATSVVAARANGFLDVLESVTEISQARQSNGLLQIVRQWRFEILPFADARVTEAELPCVQHLPRKIVGEPRRVNFVAQHRMTEMVQVHTDLMCAATVQSAFNQTSLFARTKNAILSFGRATAR